MNPFQKPKQINVAEQFRLLESHDLWDVIIVGGGATGLGLALDSASRGLKTVLFEAHDFAKGTSSRSTKLVHGGVRYLAQGDFELVNEALTERAFFFKNAPHLAQPLSLVVPTQSVFQKWWLLFGLSLYDWFSKKASIQKTKSLNQAATFEALPSSKKEKVMGGVQYWDGQFDDARMCIELMQTAAQHGALLFNYTPVTGFLFENERVVGVRYQPKQMQAEQRELKAKVVINCTGVWADDLREKAAPKLKESGKFVPMVQPSQGVHLVVHRDFLGGDHAILIPKTADGRVLFAIPWLGHVVIGTTDTPISKVTLEPRPLKEEIDFLLKECAHVFQKAPTRADVLSHWVGVRPLVTAAGNDDEESKKISRKHVIRMGKTGLVTVTGGKWTIYRRMAEDALAFCEKEGLLSNLASCRTHNLPLIGAGINKSTGLQPTFTHTLKQGPGMHLYGVQRALVEQIEGAEKEIVPGLNEAMVRYAARFEMAQTVEDVLARRSRILFLNAKLAQQAAKRVSEILKEEIGIDCARKDGYDGALAEFMNLSAGYLSEALPS